MEMRKMTIEELIAILTPSKHATTTCRASAEFSARGETLRRAVTELGDRGPAAIAAVRPLLRLIWYHEDQEARGRAVLSLGLIAQDYIEHIEELTADGDERHRISQFDFEGARGYVRWLLPKIDAGPVWSYRSESEWIEWIIHCHPGVVPDLVAAFAKAVARKKERNELREILATALVLASRDNPEVTDHIRPLLKRRSIRVREAAARLLERIEKRACV